jgi:hypothetical protein
VPRGDDRPPRAGDDADAGRELGPEAINPYLEDKSIYASADQIKK